MRPGSIFYSLLILLFSCLLIATGIFFLYASQSSYWHARFLELLLNVNNAFIWCGFFFIILGFLIVTVFLNVFRRQYYIIAMGPSYPISIDIEIMRKDLSLFLSSLFPNEAASCDISIKEKKQRLKCQQLEFYADLPYVIFEERESVLTEIENYLKVHLEKHYGYKDVFLFNVSFQERHH